jgi:phage-related minor tail protein
VAENGVAKIGSTLDHLSSRFELVIEAVTGFGGKLDAIREEMQGQFAEVGKQIRFLCDQLAENRASLNSVRRELTAELVRLGEALGATRVEFRNELSGLKDQNGTGHQELQRRIAESLAQARDELTAAIRNAAQLPKDALPAVGRQIAGSMEEIGAQLRAELKQTNKVLGALSKKFERFDDRVTVEVRDHTQRLRKLEGSRGRG